MQPAFTSSARGSPTCSFLVHATQCTGGDLRAIADAGVPVVVCPRSNAHYGMKSPLDRMLAAGIHPAVGTDNGMLQDGDLLAELSLLASWFPQVPLETLLGMEIGRAHG